MSQYSGHSSGSRIGMLMKSLDGGGVFARAAFNKRQAEVASQGSQRSGQLPGFNNDEVQSEEHEAEDFREAAQDQ